MSTAVLKRSAYLIAVLLCAAAYVGAIADIGWKRVRTVNWNGNPGNFAKSPYWVRTDSGYYHAKTTKDVRSLTRILADARKLGSSTVILSNWQASHDDGLEDVDLTGSSWGVTPDVRVKRLERGKGGEDASDVVCRVTWTLGAREGRYAQLDLSRSNVVDAASRPEYIVPIRSSHAGDWLGVRLIGEGGRFVNHEVHIATADRWTTVGPFMPALSGAENAPDKIVSVRFYRRAVAEPVNGPVSIEVGAMRATRGESRLRELFHVRSELGNKKDFAAEVDRFHEAGGRIILAVDPRYAWGDCVLVADERFREMVERADDGSPAFEVVDNGAFRFRMRSERDWFRTFSRACRDELLRDLQIDGVYVSGLADYKESKRPPHARMGGEETLSSSAM